MKLNIYLLLSLGQLAIASPNLDVRDVETECYSFDAVDDERMLDFNTYSACSEECGPLGKFVIAMRGSACFCLDSLPADDKKVDASKCDEPCPGYMLHTCELHSRTSGAPPGYVNNLILMNQYPQVVVVAITTPSQPSTNLTLTHPTRQTQHLRHPPQPRRPLPLQRSPALRTCRRMVPALPHHPPALPHHPPALPRVALLQNLQR